MSHSQSRAISLMTLLCGGAATQAQPPWPPPYREPVTHVVEAGAPGDLPWTLAESVMRSKNLELARVNGKYQMLMLQFDAPESAREYGAFHELGLCAGPAGVSMPPDLPQVPLWGHWVYAAPSWYVWHQLATERLPNRAGSTEQVLGPPNTAFIGDTNETAWAPKFPSEPNEWLLLEFERPMQPCRLQIYESLRPGAIKRITLMAQDGSEVEVWSGVEPTRAVKNGAAMFELKLNYPPFYSFMHPNPAPRSIFSTNRVKLYLDSAAIRGRNEIDAVALMDFSNIPQWASAAIASSSRADQAQADQGQIAPNQLSGAPIGGWKPVQLVSISTIDSAAFDLLAAQKGK